MSFNIIQLASNNYTGDLFNSDRIAFIAWTLGVKASDHSAKWRQSDSGVHFFRDGGLLEDCEITRSLLALNGTCGAHPEFIIDAFSDFILKNHLVACILIYCMFLLITV